jgi:ClpP class serine protease
MNFRLAKEIYGNPWFVDPFSFIQLSKTLESINNGAVLDVGEVKSNQFGILSKDLAYSARRISRMDDVPKGSIAVYNFDSVITKHGGMSHYGTVDIAAQFSKMEKNENVIGHIFFGESGGGSANAVKYMREVSAKSARKKPLVGYIEDIGASALMYIFSDADYILAKSEDAIVGSIGTMMSLEGFKSGTEDKTGKRHLRIYASQSINKNKEFENAINDFNYDLIKSEILDPHCQDFINDMTINRPNITPIQKTGATFKAGQCIGTLIDEIGSFEMAVNKVKELSNNNSNNQNSNKMTIEELKAEHPGVFAQVFDSGKAAGLLVGKAEENDRVNTWLVFNDLDSKKVKDGIESGEGMKEAEKLNFLRKSQQDVLKNSLEKSSTGDLTPNKEAGKIKPKDSAEAKEVDSAFDELLDEEEEGK